MNRRHFLKTAGAVSMGFMGLGLLSRCGVDLSSRSTGLIDDPFGPLLPDPEGVLDLPDGFRYTIVSRAGDAMDDGFILPHRPDGMAAFPGPDGRTVVIRNHEVNSDASPTESAFGADLALLARLAPDRIYDPGDGKRFGMGGTTTFVFDTRTQTLERQFLSLTGTIRNCAGGPTPWNTWLTCEENVDRADGQLRRDHGFIFEVPASANGLVAPDPLTAMGRFNHEAVAVDPASGIVYQTEDRGDGLLYRFIPTTPGTLRNGGRLQALAARDRHALDTRNWAGKEIAPGTVFAVQWIDLEDVLSPEDDLRFQGFERGAARFARGEGMWYGEDAVYFACTNGGRTKKGQIWKYIPSPVEGTAGEAGQPGTLELFVEPNDGNIIDNADNLTVAPWGDLIVCEDGSGDQFLVGITPEGQVYKFARNAISDSELAGCTFSPDGTTLFVNIQHSGLTVAITGPWRSA